jgi:hypothetical protein
MLGPPFPVLHNHLLGLDHVEGEVVFLAPQGQVFDLLPTGCLIVVGDWAYHCCVISKLNDGVGVMPGRAVMSEQRVQEGTEHAPLRGHRVEDQHGGYVVTYPYHLGAVFLISRCERAVWCAIEIASSVDLLVEHANWSGSSVPGIMVLT